MIEPHLSDMLRVVVSIKLGKIAASAILRRLGTDSRVFRLQGTWHGDLNHIPVEICW